MQADSFSIRRRITLLAAILLLAAAVILVIFIRDYADRASDRAFDRLLAASALTIAGAVQIEDGDVTLELPYAAFGMFAGGDRVFYSVRAPDGTLVTGYDDLAADEPLSSSLEPAFADALQQLVATDHGAEALAACGGIGGARFFDHRDRREGLADCFFQLGMFGDVLLYRRPFAAAEARGKLVRQRGEELVGGAC